MGDISTSAGGCGARAIPRLTKPHGKDWSGIYVRKKGCRDAKGDPDAMAKARHLVDDAKVALGERGAPWWEDGAPDYNRHMAKNTPYAEWFANFGK